MKTTVIIAIMLIAARLFGQDTSFVEITPQFSNAIDFKCADDYMNKIVNNNSIKYEVNNKSYSLGLAGSYYINQNTQVRLRTGFTRIQTESYYSYEAPYWADSTTLTNTQNQYHIAPGVLWNFRNEKLKLTAGFELEYSFLDDFEISSYHKSYTYIYDSLYSDTSIHRGTDIIAFPKGFSIGVAGIIGFNYTLNEFFAIGAEFSPSLSCYKFGGRVTDTPDYQGAMSVAIGTHSEKDICRLGYRFSVNFIFKIPRGG